MKLNIQGDGNIFQWITENWQAIALVFTGLGSVWAFFGKQINEFIDRRRNEKLDEVTLSEKELTFAERLQEHQETRLVKILKENEELWETIEKQRDKIFKAEEDIKKAFRRIRYYEKLLDDNDITYKWDE